MPRPSRLIPLAVTAALTVSALAATAGPSAGGTVRHRAAAAPITYAQPSGKYAWEPGDEVSGGFKVKAGKNGKPPTVSKIVFTVDEENNGYFCPPLGTTLKVKGSFKLHKANKFSQNPGPVYSPWTLSKKDAPPNDTSYSNFSGILPAKATVEWGGNSYPADVAMFFVRERPGRPFKGYGAVVWYAPVPPELGGGTGSCGYGPSFS